MISVDSVLYCGRLSECSCLRLMNVCTGTVAARLRLRRRLIPATKTTRHDTVIVIRQTPSARGTFLISIAAQTP